MFRPDPKPEKKAKKPKKPIRKFSKKRAKKLREYNPLNKKFLEENPYCECGEPATEVHHLYSGKNRDKYLLDVSTWMALCWGCHRMVHDELSEEEAVKLGYKLIDK